MTLWRCPQHGVITNNSLMPDSQLPCCNIAVPERDGTMRAIGYSEPCGLLVESIAEGGVE